MPPFTNTSVYSPALAYAPISGITVPANQAPDTGNSNIVIKMTLTAYSPPARKTSVNLVGTIPFVEESTNTVWGGAAISDGAQTLAKASIEGFIDTPTNSSDNLPTVTVTATGQKMSYVELIAACFEGRAGAVGVIWQRLNPLWFRDPYGRQYSSPRILDFSANYVEAVPGRHNFTMAMVV